MEVFLRRHWWLPALLLSGLTVFLGFFVRQDTFRPLLFGYAAFFLLYLVILHFVQSTPEIRIWLRVSILLRCILLFAFPALSDDVFRFLWDGYLCSAGNNPYAHSPAEWLWADSRPAHINMALYDQLNSRGYSTVYPPFAQGLFAIATLLGGPSWYWSAFFLKLLLFGFELLTLRILPGMLEISGTPQKNILIYALNPLVLLEGIGNAHLEIAVVGLVLLAVSCWYRRHGMIAALSLAAAIATKLIPLLFLSFWIRLTNTKSRWRFYGTAILATTLLFVPIVAGVDWSRPAGSLMLFFQNFEFNAGLFNIIKRIGIWTTGYNPIQWVGPLLAFHILTGVLIGAWIQRDLRMQGLLRNLMFAMSLYLLLSTTVHPWYLIPMLAFSTFTDFRYPLLWTGLAIVSYSHYMTVPFAARYGWLAVEYIPVFALLAIELLRFRIQER